MENKIYNGYVEEKDEIKVNKETGEITPEKQTDNAAGYYPTCRFCGRQFLPLANYESQAAARGSIKTNSKRKRNATRISHGLKLSCRTSANILRRGK